MTNDKDQNLFLGAQSFKDFSMDETTASKYALQVALQTMKERCQQLQTRLTVVEEENLKLKLENQTFTLRHEETSSRSSLEEQVTQLNKQKASLTHHIFMVANENKQLWTRLSQLTEVNETLGDHLSKISDTLNKHTPAAPRPSNSLSLVSKMDKKISGTRDESLEEISLKILNSFKQEKSDLEQQCNEMVELQKIQADLSATGDFDNQLSEIRSDAILEEMKNCKNQLNVMEKTVISQQLLLVAALEKLKLKKFRCREDHKTREDDDVQIVAEIRNMSKQTSNEESENKNKTNLVNMNPGNTRLCPLCSLEFHLEPNEGKDFEAFQDHVNEHFVTEDETEMASILHHFEVIGPN